MLLKLNKRSFAVKNQNFLSNIYQKLKFGELTNSYMILYLSQFDMLVNNSDRLFGLAQRAMGRRLFFYMLGNTIGKHFTGGENLEQVKMVCNKLSANNINMAVNYLAEFIEERECDEFFDQNCERYLKTCELNDQDKEYEFFNAIKLSGMVRFAHLKRFNENQERLEELFMGNDKLQQNDKGYYLGRSDLIESIQSVNSSLNKEDIDSFIDLIKLNEESDRVYYVEWRLNCGFTNIHNKSVQDHSIYRTRTLIILLIAIQVTVGVGFGVYFGLFTKGLLPRFLINQPILLPVRMFSVSFSVSSGENQVFTQR